MANKIRGVTVEIGGDTSGLNKALDNTNKQIKSTQSQLRDVEKLLKLDPSNTELLEQKQKLLGDRVKETTEKLKTLEEAEAQLKEAGVDENSEQFMALQREIISTREYLKDATEDAEKFNIKLEQTKAKFDDVSDKAGEVAEKTKTLSTIGGAVVGAVAGIGVEAVKSYADFEQLIGGVETLFGEETAKQIQKNAEAAFRTAGVSANDYMETVTSFSASLISSLGGDTEKAGKIADMALIDMADNANKMGSSLESIQIAYAGFAKGQYQLLDNLKLGYGGTKTEMERLLVNAQKITGIKYDINNLGDVYSAIHVIQEELGVAGATAKEAEGTISGAIGMTKASIENLMTALGTANADVDSAIQDVINSVKAVADNVIPVIKTFWDNLPLGVQITTAIAGVVAVISPIASIISKITSTISTMLPVLSKITAFATANPILAIGTAVALLATLIITNWDKIKPVLDNIWAKVKEVFDNIKEKVKSVFEAIKGFFKTYINGYIKVLNLLISGINTLINGLNRVSFDVPDWVPVFGGKKWGFNIRALNQIPLLANGGVVSQGQAIVGEKGAELLTVGNGQAKVQPLTNNSYTTINQTSTRPIEVTLTLDKQVLARQMFTPNANETIRRGSSLVGAY